MNDVSVITGIGAGGAIAGWMARHFRNGTGGQSSEVIVLLREIAKNTAGQPEVFRELRDYMTTGRIAMDKIDRLENRGER